MQWFDFDLHLDDRVSPLGERFEFDESGAGPRLVLGYAPAPEFRFEVGLSAADLNARPADGTAAAFGFDLAALVPLLRTGRTELALMGGLGFGGYYFDSDEFQGRALLGSVGELGLSGRWRLGRWVSLEGRAVYAVHGLAREAIDLEDDSDDLRVIGGTAWVRTVGFGLVFTL